MTAPTTRASVKIPRLHAQTLPGVVTNAPAHRCNTRARTASRAGVTWTRSYTHTHSHLITHPHAYSTKHSNTRPHSQSVSQSVTDLRTHALHSLTHSLARVLTHSPNPLPDYFREGAIPTAPTTRASRKTPRLNAQILRGVVTNAPARAISTRGKIVRRAGTQISRPTASHDCA